MSPPHQNAGISHIDTHDTGIESRGHGKDQIATGKVYCCVSGHTGKKFSKEKFEMLYLNNKF
jgi:hypothetical protein